MSDIIEISHVTKKYGAATVLNDVNISFEKGKIHGLIGRNGSGKTMLMKCICGFVPVTQGSVTVNGKTAKASVEVKINDIIEIRFGSNTTRVKVLNLNENPRKEEASLMYESVE